MYPCRTPPLQRLFMLPHLRPDLNETQCTHHSGDGSGPDCSWSVDTCMGLSFSRCAAHATEGACTADASCTFLPHKPLPEWREVGFDRDAALSC